MILDHTGAPFSARNLTEPQTAQIASLHHSGARHPGAGITPAKIGRILKAAEQGDVLEQYELFNDMEQRDAHLFAEMSKRKNAPLTLSWDIVAPNNATAIELSAVDYARETIKSLSGLDQLMRDLSDALGKGFAAVEPDWALQERRWLPKAFTFQPQTWFKFDRATRRKLRLRDGSEGGAELRPFGWIVHTHQALSGYLAESALYRVLVWPYLYKHYGVRDLAEFLEIYGLPLRLGKFGPGHGAEEKATLLRAVTQLGHNAAGIIPEGMSIEFQKAADGTEAPFKTMIELMERLQSKAILGQTLSSSEGTSGTQALGTIHKEVMDDLLIGDARALAATLTQQLVYPLIAINFAQLPIARCPRFEFDCAKPEDIAGLADSLPKLAAAGARIPVSWVENKLGVPAALEGEPLLGAAAPAPEPEPTSKSDPERSKKPDAPKVKLTQLSRTPTPAPSPEPDLLDELIAAHAQTWQPLTEQLIAPIQAALAAAIAKGQSCADFQASLPALLQQIPQALAAEQLGRAAFAAALMGEADLDLTGLDT